MAMADMRVTRLPGTFFAGSLHGRGSAGPPRPTTDQLCRSSRDAGHTDILHQRAQRLSHRPGLRWTARGRGGTSPSKFSETCPRQASQRYRSIPWRNARTVFFAAAVLLRTLIRAVRNGPNKAADRTRTSPAIEPRQHPVRTGRKSPAAPGHPVCRMSTSATVRSKSPYIVDSRPDEPCRGRDWPPTARPGR